MQNILLGTAKHLVTLRKSSGILSGAHFESIYASIHRPFNPEAIPDSKLAPSLPYSSRGTQPCQDPDASEKLRDLEDMMQPSNISLFNGRYEEQYDIQNEFYSIWFKLKALNIGNKTSFNSSSELSPTSSITSCISSNKVSASCTPHLDEIP